jgi:ABC-type transport system involved in cytochrome bd biosynthesis fused ATPase/permease subunit
MKNWIIRRELAIIPQEPFVFGGSLRENVDPEGQHTTAEVWAALRKCHLEEVAFRLGSIDFQLRADALSAGQKQLLCLARAVLRNAKVCPKPKTLLINFLYHILILLFCYAGCVCGRGNSQRGR